MNSIERTVGLFCLVASVTVSSSSAQQSSASDALDLALPVEKPAEQVYSSIRALNGVPYGELIAGMQVMSEALGVDCEHCHSQSGDRDVEGNPNKDIARDMIRMVRDLNQRSFGGRNVISCYTCHRGSTTPLANVSLANANVVQPAAVSLEESLLSPRQVLDEYVVALGGADALRKNTSRVEAGTLTILSAGNQIVPIQSYAQSPDRRRTNGFTVSHLGNSAQAFGVVSGAQGWMRESNGPVRLMFGWRRDAAQLEDLLNLPRRVEQLLRDLRVDRRQQVNGRDAIVLSARTDFLSLVELSFDAATDLLLRIAYYVDTTAGRMPSRIDYSDYRDVAGVKVPFHWNVTLVRGVRVSYQLTDVKQNVPVEAAQFALPRPPPSLYR